MAANRFHPLVVAAFFAVAAGPWRAQGMRFACLAQTCRACARAHSMLEAPALRRIILKHGDGGAPLRAWRGEGVLHVLRHGPRSLFDALALSELTLQLDHATAWWATALRCTLRLRCPGAGIPLRSGKTVFTLIGEGLCVGDQAKGLASYDTQIGVVAYGILQTACMNECYAVGRPRPALGCCPTQGWHAGEL